MPKLPWVIISSILITSSSLVGGTIGQQQQQQHHSENDNGMATSSVIEVDIDLHASNRERQQQEEVVEEQCTVRRKTTGTDQTVFRFGILAIRGVENAWKEWNSTAQYLTAVVGPQFDPPISIELVPVVFGEALSPIDQFQDSSKVDFFMANPSIYSCVDSEQGSTPLATVISKRNVGGNVFKLTQFGGVILTQADNDDIQTIQDIQGKRIGLVSVAGLGSGQMQFRELQMAGLHHLQDPSQLIFMENQGNIVQGVLTGDIDVGFIRTDMLERSVDKRTGEPVDPSLVKIIGVKSGLQNEGIDFPFPSSTQLYPEWSFASLLHVPNVVGLAVQAALIQMKDHASIAPSLQVCYEEKDCLFENATDTCQEDCFNALDPALFEQCYSSGTTGTTAEIAMLAQAAMTNAKNDGWRLALSYMELRSMQEENGFIGPDPITNAFQCIRTTSVSDAVVCPPGHFKKSDTEIENGCDDTGLDCYGFSCICKPCVKAFDVDFFPIGTSRRENDDDDDDDDEESALTATAAVANDLFNSTTRSTLPQSGQGCDKFSFCGEVEQSHEITFYAIDNRKRENVQMTATVLYFDSTESVEMAKVSDYEYTFTLSAYDQAVGTIVVSVFVNGEAIPESPFRVSVIPRDCALDTGDELRVADGSGNCICERNTVPIGNHCVPLTTLLPSIFVPFIVIMFAGMLAYVRQKKIKADSVWKVLPEELSLDNPTHILGQGTFGKVLLGEYRGTKVAVKRALPPKRVFSGPTSSASGNEKVEPAKPGLVHLGESAFQIGQQSKSQEMEADDDSDDRDHDENDSNNMTGVDESYDEEAAATTTSTTKLQKSTASLPAGNTKSTFDGKNQHANNYADIRLGMASIGFLANSAGSNNGENSQSQSRSHSRKKSSIGIFGGRDEYSLLQDEFIIEMRHLSKLRHPCITTVMGAVVSPNFEPMLVMEHMELGSFHDLLHNESMMIETDTVYLILRDIIQGLRFLHTAQPPVIHGDLKSRNVLINAQFRAKVADFGLSSHRRYAGVATGTPLWMAPELLRKESRNSPRTDMYSFGIVLYEAFSRKTPYEGQDLFKTLQQIIDKEVNLRPPVPQSCPLVIAEMMKGCLQGDPSSRPSSSKVDDQLKVLQSQSAERTGQLLSELFPPNIVKALRDGRKVEPELHDCVSVFFCDVVDYTGIAGRLSQEKLNDLLERLHQKFDRICGLHDVFKVDTVGDAFMAVTNLANEQKEHATTMAHFALDILHAARSTSIDSDDSHQGCVQVRMGIHSGPVASHVVGSKNPRYTILGDTVSTAARMEHTCEDGKIQCSQTTAKLLELCADIELNLRGVVELKGKEKIETYFLCQTDDDDSLASSNASAKSSQFIALTGDMKRSMSLDDTRRRSYSSSGDSVITFDSRDSGSSGDEADTYSSSGFSDNRRSRQRRRKTTTRDRMIDLNVKVLSKYLRKVIAWHMASTEGKAQESTTSSISNGSTASIDPVEQNKRDGKTVMDEVTEVINLPEYNAKVARRMHDSDVNAPLSEDLITDLTEFVATVCQMYNSNSFHSFDHASHVMFSLHKLLSSVVAPKELNNIDIRRREFTVHEYTYGISSDPLTQLAVVFSALIHDVDHPGVPNSQLVKEKTELAATYHDKSVAEQNSIDLAWTIWMSDEYENLRNAVTGGCDKEHNRFRQLIVNTVLATDIVDKELKALRNKRWESAFSERAMDESPHENVNRKATVVLEHLIQASDIAHTMQHWHIYRKWNERFFNECCAAYEEGRAENDPSENWYKGELGFFDFYIIPLTQKLKDCGVFGESSSEYLDRATRNREEWEIRGEEVVAEMIARRKAKKGQPQKRITPPRDLELLST